MREISILSGHFRIPRRSIIRFRCFAALALFYAGCSSVTIPLYELPPDWKDDAIREKTIAEYSKYLAGKKIFLDPGHGGEDRKNMNKNGTLIEADLNLRVALYLRDYLTRAGAEVKMSREKDETVPLAYRSELANKSGADLLISIHHNAPASWEDDYTNYTSTYYHATENDYQYEPSERDLARYIQRDLSYVMGNPGGLGSFDGTYSDFLIYPGEGFSVLRKTKIPAVLIECAFHTSRLEELRLNDETFNQIQAWGIFRGISKYFRVGIPSIEFLNASSDSAVGKVKLFFALKDTLGIDFKQTRVFAERHEIEFQKDVERSVISFEIDPAKSPEIKIITANKKGNHSLPFIRKIKVNDSRKIELQLAD